MINYIIKQHFINFGLKIVRFNPDFNILIEGCIIFDYLLKIILYNTMNKLYKNVHTQQRNGRSIHQISSTQWPLQNRESQAKQNLIKIPEIQNTIDYKTWNQEKRIKQISFSMLSDWQEEDKSIKNKNICFKSQRFENKLYMTPKNRAVKRLDKSLQNPNHKLIYTLKKNDIVPPVIFSSQSIKKKIQIHNPQITQIMNLIIKNRQNETIRPSSRESAIGYNNKNVIKSPQKSRSISIRAESARESSNQSVLNFESIEEPLKDPNNNFPLRKRKRQMKKKILYPKYKLKIDQPIEILKKALLKINKQKFDMTKYSSKNIKQFNNHTETVIIGKKIF